MKKWLSNVNFLKGLIVALIGGLAWFISRNIAYSDEIDRLKFENAKQDSLIISHYSRFDSYQYIMREWKWSVEDALKHADIIYFESGILRTKE